MEVIPVLDVRGGRVVHAMGGDRARYVAPRSRLVTGDEPRAFARAFVCRLGVRRVYLADLTAIGGGGTGLEATSALVGALARDGLEVWVDAGVSSRTGTDRLLDAGAARVVAGLETLCGARDLDALIAAFGADRLLFSLDLRDGRPLATDPRLARTSPERIARRATDAGFRDLLLLDLARVGRRAGPPLDWLAALGAAAPAARWFVGGGVRDASDLRALRDAGCVGALVGTAVHVGAVGRGEIAALRSGRIPAGRRPGGPSTAAAAEAP
ncbi:MAG: HisA/HisF-related TIM barrel protein [Gemmatimonadota bacterium]